MWYTCGAWCGTECVRFLGHIFIGDIHDPGIFLAVKFAQNKWMPRQTNNPLHLSPNDIFVLKRKGETVSDISITIGNRKYKVSNIEAYITKQDGMTYISIPSLNAIFNDKNEMIGEADRQSALRTLRSSGASGKAGKKSLKGQMAVPAELASLLEKFNKENHALVIADGKGGYKVQKKRKPKN